MDSGTLLGDRYRLLSRLGTGGMSVVWLAHDERLDLDVAVKIMNYRAATDRRLRERLRAEARMAAQLNHTHVVDVRDCGETRDGEPYVVMERLRGESLARVAGDTALPWPFAVRVVAQLSTALAAAHRQGIVHRDVAPGNVILDPDGVKLVDFGISARTGEPDVGPDDTIMGTPAYLAPERLERTSVDPATDIYALGVMLYRLLAGRPPWNAVTVTDMLNAHYSEEPAPLPPIAGLPAQVRDLCHQCLAKDPAERPDAATLADTLQGLTPATEVTTVLPPRLSLQSRTRQSSPTRAFAAGVVALAVLVMVMAIGLGDPNASDPRPYQADPSVSALGSNPVDCRTRHDRQCGSTVTSTEPAPGDNEAPTAPLVMTAEPATVNQVPGATTTGGYPQARPTAPDRVNRPEQAQRARGDAPPTKIGPGHIITTVDTLQPALSRHAGVTEYQGPPRP